MDTMDGQRPLGGWVGAGFGLVVGVFLGVVFLFASIFVLIALLSLL